MNTVRLNITLPVSVNNDITRYADELNEKKSHLSYIFLIYILS